mgnify:CR=1 FL=1
MDEKKFKMDALVEIMKKEGVAKEEIMLVGDGKNERDVALEAGCDFVGVTNEFKSWQQNDRYPVIINLHELKDYLKQ